MIRSRGGRRAVTGCVMAAVDESPTAASTLLWAAAYARLTERPLVAVHVLYHGGGDATSEAPTGQPGFPRLGAPGAIATSSAVVVPSPAGGAEDASGSPTPPMVQGAFDAVCPEADWALEVIAGESVGPVVVDRAVGAAVLVLGSSARTGVRRLLAGSVSDYCVSHTAVPVVAVPA